MVLKRDFQVFVQEKKMSWQHLDAAVCHGYCKNDAAAEKMDIERLPPASVGRRSSVTMLVTNNC